MMEQFHQKNYGSDVNNSIVFTKQSTLTKTSFQRKTQVDRDIPKHGLRTPNEVINQRYLKNQADVADKIRYGRT